MTQDALDHRGVVDPGTSCAKPTPSMPLIITVGTPDKFVQASDRRLTRSDGNVTTPLREVHTALVRRDRDTDARLTQVGWIVLRFWEHEEPKAAARFREANPPFSVLARGPPPDAGHAPP
jgi:hypothetical protein